MANGSCTVAYKNGKHKPTSCSSLNVAVIPNSDNCNVTRLTTKNWLTSACKGDFTVLCSKGDISIDLQCILSNSSVIKKINGKHC